jgi:hypothetical protein
VLFYSRKIICNVVLVVIPFANVRISTFRRDKLYPSTGSKREYGQITHNGSVLSTDLCLWRLSKISQFISRKKTCIITQSVLGPVHTLIQSKFSTQCNLVLPLSIYRILSFLLNVMQKLLTSLLRLHSTFPSITCFGRQFQYKI